MVMITFSGEIASLSAIDALVQQDIPHASFMNLRKCVIDDLPINA